MDVDRARDTNGTSSLTRYCARAEIADMEPRQAGSRDADRIRMGWLIERSTRRWGKPATWGRTRREHAARKGNSCRTCRAGAHEPTSLRGLAIRRCAAVWRIACAKASVTEEPDAGIPHVRDCAGGAR